MVEKNDVAAVLDLIRPSLQADGGDVKLVDVDENGVVSVELQGACKGCPMSQMTLANGVERILKERVPGVTKVVPADCRFAACERDTHVVCQDFNVLLNPERDYDAAVKEVCRFCEHFLVRGPSVADREAGAVARQGNPNRFLL